MAENTRDRLYAPRRRTRSVGSIPSSWERKNQDANIHSDDMESNNTVHFQSDSDDQYDTHSSLSHNENFNIMESDPLATNVSSRMLVKRKRKFRKVAMDLDANNTARWHVHMQVFNKRRKHASKNTLADSRRYCVKNGKRKRIPDKNCAMGSVMDQESKVLALSKLSLNDEQEQDDVMMDTVSPGSSSSISSSASDIGICTDDRGLDGDDEQSDWFNDAALNKIRASEANCWNYNFGPMLNDTRKVNKPAAKLGKEGDVRGSKRRVRKTNFDFLVHPNETHSECSPSPMELDLSYKKPEQAASTSSRRHTFSGLKKRKRVPTVLFESVTDRSSLVTHGLSDISSSDPRDFLLEDI